MLLDVIMFGFIWAAVLMTLFFDFIKNTDLGSKMFSVLPFNWLPIVFLIGALMIIRYRGHVTTWWNMIDFPNPKEKRGIVGEGSNIYSMKLYPSIEGYLKTKDDAYFKDTKDGYFSGGHDTRLIDPMVAHTVNPERAIMSEALDKDGFVNYDEVKGRLIAQMCFLKEKNNGNNYLLTGSEKPESPANIDIVNNPGHKAVFEALANEHLIKVNGRCYTLKQYHKFQEKTASPSQIGSIVHYIKAVTAMRAAKVRKGMGLNFKVLFIIILIVMIGLGVGAFFLSGGSLPIPGV